MKPTTLPAIQFLKEATLNLKYEVGCLGILIWPALLMFTLAHAPSAQAQGTVTIYNQTSQDFSVSPSWATTCAPPWTQGIGCYPVPANGSYAYTPPSGSVWYGFKVYCGTGCSTLVSSIACAGRSTTFNCSGNTYSMDLSGNSFYIRD